MLKDFNLSTYYGLLYELRYKYALTDEWSLELDKGQILEIGINGSRSSLPTNDIQELENILENYRQVIRGQIWYSDKESFIFVLDNDIPFLEFKDAFFELYTGGMKTLKVIEDNPLLLKFFSVTYNLEGLDKNKLTNLGLFNKFIKSFIRICDKSKSDIEFYQDEIHNENDLEKKARITNLREKFDTSRSLVLFLIKDFPL